MHLVFEDLLNERMTTFKNGFSSGGDFVARFSVTNARLAFATTLMKTIILEFITSHSPMNRNRQESFRFIEKAIHLTSKFTL